MIDLSNSASLRVPRAQSCNLQIAKPVVAPVSIVGVIRMKKVKKNDTERADKKT